LHFWCETFLRRYSRGFRFVRKWRGAQNKRTNSVDKNGLLHGFPGLLPILLSISVFTVQFFLFPLFSFWFPVACGRLSWLMTAFGRTLKQRLVSYRNKPQGSRIYADENHNPAKKLMQSKHVPLVPAPPSIYPLRRPKFSRVCWIQLAYFN